MVIDDRLVFGIPLKPAKASANWDQVQRNLAATIASIRNSTASGYIIVVAGHDRPDGIGDDVKFLAADFPPPASANGGVRDKFRKRRLIGAWMRRNCGERARIMFLDADDWIHRDLVGTVLAGEKTDNFVLEKGFRYDVASQSLERVGRRFWNSCGSTFIASFAREELPARWDDEDNRYARYTNHRELIAITEADGGTVRRIDYPAGVYVVNHPDSLEMIKHGMKSWNHGTAVEAEDERRILREEFGVDPEIAFSPPVPGGAEPAADPSPPPPPVPAAAGDPFPGLGEAIARHLGRQQGRYNLVRLAELGAAIDSVQHWQAHAPDLTFFRDVAGLRRQAFARASADGFVIHIGDPDAAGARQLRELAGDRPVFAIDAASLDDEDPDVPRPDPLVEGIEALIADDPAPIAFIEFEDADHDRTRQVLELLGSRLAAGSVMLFDQFWNHVGWRQGAYRAVAQSAASRGYAIGYLHAMQADQHMAIVLKDAVRRMRG